ncbi:MAG: hypothetical protein JXJ30_01995, partial [Halothiobacillaceae bacterium]|nr:hypothetical protein [Halothiobacillaceae bacterium]
MEDRNVTARISSASPAALVDFQWWRMADGRWIGPRSQRLLAGHPADDGYQPLKREPALFRKFADVRDTEDAFAEFAMRYGDLESGGVVVVDDHLATGKEMATDDPFLVYSEGRSFEIWRGHRRMLAFALRLWDAINEGRADELIGAELLVKPYDSLVEPGKPVPKYMVWTRTASAQRDLGLTASQTSNAEFEPAVPLMRASLPEAAARAALAYLVSEMCASARVVMRVTSAQPDGLRLTFEVRSLIAAMWLQFALAVDGQREYRPCPVCGDWWDATEARSDRKTCSDRCRKRMHRQTASGGT